jgi:voltage-gated potassium channel
MIHIFSIIIDFLSDKAYRTLTLSTIGYGDLYPKTDIGKIFTVFYILIDVGIIFGFINAFYEHRVIRYKEIRREKSEGRR